MATHDSSPICEDVTLSLELSSSPSRITFVSFRFEICDPSSSCLLPWWLALLAPGAPQKKLSWIHQISVVDIDFHSSSFRKNNFIMNSSTCSAFVAQRPNSAHSGVRSRLPSLTICVFGCARAQISREQIRRPGRRVMNTRRQPKREESEEIR